MPRAKKRCFATTSWDLATDSCRSSGVRNTTLPFLSRSKRRREQTGAGPPPRRAAARQGMARWFALGGVNEALPVLWRRAQTFPRQGTRSRFLVHDATTVSRTPGTQRPPMCSSGAEVGVDDLGLAMRTARTTSSPALCPGPRPDSGAGRDAGAHWRNIEGPCRRSRSISDRRSMPR